jgi:hypothetical protein
MFHVTLRRNVRNVIFGTVTGAKLARVYANGPAANAALMPFAENRLIPLIYLAWQLQKLARST